VGLLLRIAGIGTLGAGCWTFNCFSTGTDFRRSIDIFLSENNDLEIHQYKAPEKVFNGISLFRIRRSQCIRFGEKAQ
jgi:hypothetical protein